MRLDDVVSFSGKPQALTRVDFLDLILKSRQGGQGGQGGQGDKGESLYLSINQRLGLLIMFTNPLKT